MFARNSFLGHPYPEIKMGFKGAKTVNGPAFARTCSIPAAWTAATNVVWSLEPAATWRIFLADSLSTTEA